ncbi:MAG: hypothetical protein ABEJ73_11170 [Haloplanus sp.]
MSRAVPDGWLKVGRREYESRTVDVEVEVLPTPEQDGNFEVRVFEDDDSTVVENVQSNEKDALELAKAVITTFNEEFQAALDEGVDDDDAVSRAVERAAAKHRA